MTACENETPQWIQQKYINQKQILNIKVKLSVLLIRFCVFILFPCVFLI